MFEKRRGGLKGESLCKFKKNEMWMFLEWVYMPSFLDPLIFLTFIIVFKIKIDGNSPGFHEAYLNGRIFFLSLFEWFHIQNIISIQFLNFDLQPIQ